MSKIVNEKCLPLVVLKHTHTHTHTHILIDVEKQWQGLLKRDQFIRSVSGQEPYQQM
jgi:hypothetical protein